MLLKPLRDAFSKLKYRPAFSSGVDTSILFVVAIGLIVNSHLELYYPYAWLAADGLFGNTMFFFLSGFAIAHSSTRVSFIPYVSRRIWRIYPAVIIAVLIGLTISTLGVPATIIGTVNLFLWPTPFTFVTLIVPFYFLLWFIRFRGVKTLYILSAMILLAASLYTDFESGRFSGSFESSDISSSSFSAFFWAATICGAAASHKGYQARFTTLRIGLAAILVASYFILKFAMIVTGDVAGIAAPALLMLALFGVVACVFAIGDPEVSRRALGMPRIGLILALIANLTFEIYVVHSVLVFAPGLSGIIFPVNILALMVFTAFLVVSLRISIDALRRKSKDDG